MTTRTELAELIGAEIKVLKAIRRRIRDLPPEEVAEAYCKIRQPLWPVWVWAVAAPAYTWRKTDLSRPEFAALLLSLTLVVALVATAAGMARRSGEPAPVWLVQAIVWPIVLCALVLGFSLVYAPDLLPGHLAASGHLPAKLGS